MQITVIKRDGSKVPFNFEKIKNAVNKAFNAVYQSDAPEDFINLLEICCKTIDVETITVEEIQDMVENMLMDQK